MSNDELSTQDVLTDPSKNLCTIYNQDDDDEETVTATIHDNQYFTETDFVDFVQNSNFTNANNLTILSVTSKF